LKLILIQFKPLKIEINNNRKIFAIEGEFNRVFPNLKIKFFAKPNAVGREASEKLVAADKSLESCRVVHNEGVITITAGMTIDSVKQNFRDVYGLTIQVLKKSGSDWIVVDNEGHSLEEQNKPQLPKTVDAGATNDVPIA